MFEKINFGDGIPKDDELVIGDTNVFLQDGSYSIGPNLERFLHGKTKIVLKETKNEIGKKARLMEQTCKTANIKQERYDVFLKHIQLLQRRMIEKPKSTMSIEWLVRKRKMRRRDIQWADAEIMKEHLKELRNDAERVDNIVLAKAAALSTEYKVYFLSRDTDHLVIKDVVEKKVTDEGGRLMILNPKDVNNGTVFIS